MQLDNEVTRNIGDNVVSRNGESQDYWQLEFQKFLRRYKISQEKFLCTPINELQYRHKIPKDESKRFLYFFQEQNKHLYFSTAFKDLISERKRATITMGPNQLDNLFFLRQFSNGGLRSGQIYEVAGPFGSGKSQIAHLLTISTQLPKQMGGIEKKAIFIDTEGTFSPSRLVSIIQHIKEKYAWEKNEEDILKDITVIRSRTSDDLYNTLLQIEILVEKNDFGIIIIDSVMAHFRAEFDNTNLIERQQKLIKHLSILKRISQSQEITILLTNQIQHNFKIIGEQISPIGGNILAHWSSTRLLIRKLQANRRLIRIIDSPVFDNRECYFTITENGIE